MPDHCKHCRNPLPSRKRNPGRLFCGRAECQRARKNQWQKKKLRDDPDYRENQKRANKQWRKKNPGYWREYRRNNQEYTEKNRVYSKQRMQLRRQLESLIKMFAKMDASLVDSQGNSGYYGLIPLGDMFAKMDAKFLKIECSQRDMDEGVQVCKYRTVSPAL